MAAWSILSQDCDSADSKEAMHLINRFANITDLKGVAPCQHHLIAVVMAGSMPCSQLYPVTHILSAFPRISWLHHRRPAGR